MSTTEQLAAPVVLRRALLVLAGGGVAAVAFELASTRHWDSAVQLVPWVALGVCAIALALVAARPRRTAIRAARALLALVVAASVYGVITHVDANFDAGPLDGTYGPRWEATAVLTRVWWAFTQTVGPSPVLAPAALAQVGLLVLLATWRHPALEA